MSVALGSYDRLTAAACPLVFVPTPVESHDPEGIDYGWIMQVTFVVTILVGAPLVAVLSTGTTLPTWGARVEFAIRVGAVVWVLVALSAYVYARRRV